MPKTQPPLSALLPPLIFGSATFNTQYNKDAYELPTTKLVEKALSLGVRAFDTSPYYGPSESLLGAALSSPSVVKNFPRPSYYILTKAGRVSGSVFDYSAAAIRASVARSCARLGTSYLDVVYCHDAEFVTPAEVLAAVRELRRLRDEDGSVRYVGISGYPVAALCELAELVLAATGEPLDAVQSYANYTLQSHELATAGLPRLAAAGVDVVPNASVLGMGLLRRSGVPVGGQGDWHPAPAGLRKAVARASARCDARGDRLEKVAIRHAVETWLRAGARCGGAGDPASGIARRRGASAGDLAAGGRLGVSVFGVSNVFELDETVAVWRSILAKLVGRHALAREPGRSEDEYDWSVARGEQVRDCVAEVREVLGDWYGFAWQSPAAGFVREVHVPDEEERT